VSVARRRLLRGCAGCAAMAWLPGCGGLTFVPAKLVDGRLAVPQRAFADRRCIGLEHPRLLVPIAVCRVAAADYAAVRPVCTHKGCDLRPDGAAFECPCHGSRFGLDGRVLAGPAKDALRQFSVTTDERMVYVGA